MTSSNPQTGETATGTDAPPGHRSHRARAWVNWALALLTVPGAILVRIFALGAVMSTAACSTAECPDIGPSGAVFNALFYGPLVVAAATILLSFFTASRRRGIIVPLGGWALLLADAAALAVTFSS